MRAEFVAVATLVLLAGVCLAKYSRLMPLRASSTLTISDGNNYEQIKSFGQIRFNEEETAIAGMSAGAWLKFTKNDLSFKAESDSSGHIVYVFNEDGKKDQQQLVTLAVRDMIAYGYDAEGHLQRLARAGGNNALIAHLDSCRNDHTKHLFLDHILASDSLKMLPEQQWLSLIAQLARFGSSQDRSRLLIHIADSMPRTDTVRTVWMATARTLGSDEDYGRTIRALPAQHQL